MIPWRTYNMNKMKTNDNANIYYYEHQPIKKDKEKGILIIIPGWAYIADTWSPVLETNEYLKQYYHVFIIITRGYNNEYYNYGNTMDRYSMDIYEFFKYKNLTKNISLLGHSIGGALIWRMISLFGEQMFKNYIIVDEPPVLLKNKINMSISDINTQKGMVYTPKMLEKTFKILHGPKARKQIIKYARYYFTTKFQKEHPEIVDRVLNGTLKFNNNVLVDILIDVANMNNITLILQSQMITKPTLLIGGEQSMLNDETIVSQGKYYKHPTIYIFEEDGSSHSMFIEKYMEFNKVLNKFLQQKTIGNKTRRIRSDL